MPWYHAAPCPAPGHTPHPWWRGPVVGHVRWARLREGSFHLSPSIITPWKLRAFLLPVEQMRELRLKERETLALGTQPGMGGARTPRQMERIRRCLP